MPILTGCGRRADVLLSMCWKTRCFCEVIDADWVPEETSEDAGPDSRFIRCEWKMDYKMMANTGNSDSTRVHSPLDVFV